MKRTQALLAALSMMALPAVSLAEAVDLRGPGLAVGQVMTIVNEMSTEESEMNMDVQGQAMEGSMSMESRQVSQVDILEAEDGQPTHVVQTTVENSSTTVSNFFGQSQEQTTGQEMVGVMLDQTLTEDGWETEVVGDTGDALPPEALDMIGNIGFADPSLIYPETPVEVGEGWTVDGEALSALMTMTGMPVEVSQGEADFELVEVTVVDGTPTATITYDVELTFVMEIEQQGMDMTMTITMVGSGEIQRSLETFLETKTFEGNMGFNMVSEMGGQVMMKMNSEMPVSQITTQIDGPAEDALEGE